MHDSQRYRSKASECLLASYEASQTCYGKLNLSMAALWIALAGVSLIFAFDWLLILTPLAWVVVNRAVVRSEERYLEQRFGKDYRDYKKRVARYFFIR